jgi:hypothetical protein
MLLNENNFGSEFEDFWMTLIQNAYCMQMSLDLIYSSRIVISLVQRNKSNL